MTLNFRNRLLMEGMVDTCKYRYITEFADNNLYVKRIEKKYIGFADCLSDKSPEKS